MMVGQRVICVDDVFPDWVHKFYDRLPIKGDIYIIRDVVIGVNHQGQPGEVCLYLKELINPCSDAPPDYPERGFNAERFAPIETIEEAETKTETDLIPISK